MTLLPTNTSVTYCDKLDIQSLLAELKDVIGNWHGAMYASTALETLQEFAEMGGEEAARQGAVIVRDSLDGHITGLANFGIPGQDEIEEMLSIGEHSNLYLDYMGAESRGSGAGTKMMQAVAKEASDRDLGVLTTAHGGSDPFYEKLGMEGTPTRGGQTQYEWAPEQAKAYAQSVPTEPTLTKPNDYPTLEEAKGKGLFHPGCRHSISAYQEGLTRPMTNTADPKGYEDSQQLRYYERQIRSWKRVGAAGFDDAAKAKAQAHVRAYQAKIRKHVKETSVRRDPARERLGAF